MFNKIKMKRYGNSKGLQFFFRSIMALKIRYILLNNNATALLVLKKLNVVGVGGDN